MSSRNIPVLVCSTHEEPGYVRRAMTAGARGYITKREAPRDLARTVRNVLDGWMLISPRVAERGAVMGLQVQRRSEFTEVVVGFGICTTVNG